MGAIGDIAEIKVGMHTGSNEIFVRYWHEVSFGNIQLNCKNNQESITFDAKWYPYNKGGQWRKWYGNRDLVVNWGGQGDDIHRFHGLPKDYNGAPVRAKKYQFKESITWSDIATKKFAARYSPAGSMFDVKGSSAFMDKEKLNDVLALMCSPKIVEFMEMLNPSSTFQVGDIARVPFPKHGFGSEKINSNVTKAIDISKEDHDESELSFEFRANSLVSQKNYRSLKESFLALGKKHGDRSESLLFIERENYSLICQDYGSLAKKMVAVEDISLNSNLYFNNKGGYSSAYEKYLTGIVADLASYSVGCMVGRYSLDKPGLILASQGETVRDYLAQIPAPSFAPDDNAIIPLTDQEWFPDDATNRFRDFLRTVWGEVHLQENLDFVAESLCLHAIKPKKGEAALETIRRYLSTQFFKDHLRTYKKRPIYWLFSSGKQKAFECLVYLHRYNESTLAEMRTDYVIPLTTKLASYVEKLEQDKDASTSAAEAKAIEKELSKLYKQQAELNTFDEKLRHYADQRISLDLDDGVKVNYGKFGDLLAEVKQVVGK